MADEQISEVGSTLAPLGHSVMYVDLHFGNLTKVPYKKDDFLSKISGKIKTKCEIRILF